MFEPTAPDKMIEETDKSICSKGAAVRDIRAAGKEQLKYRADFELQCAVVHQKPPRMMRDIYKGMYDYYKEEVPEIPQEFLDNEPTVEKQLELVEKFPAPELLVNFTFCSWCDKIPEAPIYMCNEGHLICGKELKLVPNCPRMNGKMCHNGFVCARPLYCEYLFHHAKVQSIYTCKGNE